MIILNTLTWPSHAKQKNPTLSIITDERDNFVFPVHYSNGLVEIYNFVGPIYVNKSFDNEIMVNKGREKNLSFIKIDIDLVGFYDNIVHTQFKDMETKILFSKEYFELANSQLLWQG